MFNSFEPSPVKTNTSLLSGLISYYPLNEISGIRYDYAQSGFNLNDLNNNTKYTNAGIISGGAYFTGGNQTLSSNKIFKIGNDNNFSLSFWIKPSITENGRRIITFTDEINEWGIIQGEIPFTYPIQYTLTIFNKFGVPVAPFPSLPNEKSLDLNLWNHIVITKETSGVGREITVLSGIKLFFNSSQQFIPYFDEVNGKPRFYQPNGDAEVYYSAEPGFTGWHYASLVDFFDYARLDGEELYYVSGWYAPFIPGTPTPDYVIPACSSEPCNEPKFVYDYVWNYYKNGTLQSTNISGFSLENDIWPSGELLKLTIGKNLYQFNNVAPIEGIIDEIGIWNRPLIAEEIINLYNDGIGRTISKFEFSDKKSSYLNDDTKERYVNQYKSLSLISEDGLLAYWDFNSQSIIPTYFHLKDFPWVYAYNPYEYIDGIGNRKAISFSNGGYIYVEFDSNTAFWNYCLSNTNPKTSFTVSLWVKKNSINLSRSEGFIIGNRFGPLGFSLEQAEPYVINPDLPPPPDYVNIPEGYNINNNITAILKTYTDYRIASSLFNWNIGEWSYFTIVNNYEENKYSLYINGNLVDFNDYYEESLDCADDNNNYFTINGHDYSYNFISFWNRALSTQEISVLYNNPNGLKF